MPLNGRLFPAAVLRSASLALAVALLPAAARAQTALETLRRTACPSADEAACATEAGAGGPSFRVVEAASRSRYEPEALLRLLDQVSALRGAGTRPILVTDLDDTLNDTAGRRLRIFKEFLLQPEIQRDFPEEARKLRGRLEPSRMRYWPADTARDAGVGDKRFLDLLSEFFRARYWMTEYLLEDWANPGSAGFIAEAVRRGAAVVYLSARWEKMRWGTTLQLRKLGLPDPNGRDVFLYLKESEAQSDEDFKNAALYGIARMAGQVAGGFENEPRNINSFKDRFPEAIMIFIDTRSSGEKDPVSGEPIEVLPGIPWVKDFSLPERS